MNHGDAINIHRAGWGAKEGRDTPMHQVPSCRIRQCEDDVDKGQHAEERNGPIKAVGMMMMNIELLPPADRRIIQIDPLTYISFKYNPFINEYVKFDSLVACCSIVLQILRAFDGTSDPHRLPDGWRFDLGNGPRRSQ